MGPVKHKPPYPVSIEPPPRDEFLNRYVGTGTPVLMKGLVKDWSAVAHWTPAYLADLTAAMGDILVPYRSTPADMPQMDLQRIQQGMISLLEILHECDVSPDEGREIYVPGLDLPPGTPLGRYVSLPALLLGLKVYATTVFLGRNTKCIGHFHARTHALLCQVQGIKRVWMYPPAELKRLSLCPIWSDGFFRSQVNFYGDRGGFPLTSKAKGQLFELHPGDALFIPLHWLHVPEGKGWSVSVTHWWRPALREWTLSATTIRALLGIGFELARQFRRSRKWLH